MLAEPNRLVIVDEDRKGAYAEFLKKYGVPYVPTLTIRTQSSNRQYYYRVPNGYDVPANSVSKYVPQLDFRGRGGYGVCGCGRVKGWFVWIDRPIADAPVEMLEVISAKPQVRPTDAGGGNVQHSLGGILTTLSAAVEGTRNATLFWCASRVAEMPAIKQRSALWMIRNEARFLGLPDSEIDQTLRNAMKGG